MLAHIISRQKKLSEQYLKKLKQFFLAHALGNPFNLDKIQDICRKYNLWLIEDNCDTLGSKYDEKYTSTFGHVATLSFYLAPHINMEKEEL